MSEIFTIEDHINHGSEFNLGHEMGIDALDLMGKHIDAHAAEHEPIVLLGVMTALMQYALQSCTEEEGVDQLVGAAKQIAKSVLDPEESGETVH